MVSSDFLQQLYFVDTGADVQQPGSWSTWWYALLHAGGSYQGILLMMLLQASGQGTGGGWDSHMFGGDPQLHGCCVHTVLGAVAVVAAV